MMKCDLAKPVSLVFHAVPSRIFQGRFEFMADVAKELQRLDIGWAWWVWRGGGGPGFPKYGSSGFVWGTGSEAQHDDRAIDSVKPFM